MKNGKAYNSPPADIVCGALNGDDLCVEKLLLFYEPYINKLCTMYVQDAYSNEVNRYVDEDRKQVVNIAFIRGVRKFARLLALAHSI